MTSRGRLQGRLKHDERLALFVLRHIPMLEQAQAKHALGDHARRDKVLFEKPVQGFWGSIPSFKEWLILAAKA